MFTVLESKKLTALVVMLVVLVISCIYLITKTINIKNETNTLRAKYALAEKALSNPNKTSNKKVTTVTTERIVNLTEQEKKEICDQYNTRMEYLNRIIMRLQENSTVTVDTSVEKTEAAIPVDPDKPEIKKWSAGPLAIKYGNIEKIGFAVNRDIGRYLEINAGLASDLYFAGLLYKF